MAKASGPSKGALGALKAGALKAALGLAVGKTQKDNQTMLGAMMARVAHMMPFLGEALGRAPQNKNALSNLLEIAKTMEVVIGRHQNSRNALLRAPKENFELKAPAPTAGAAAKPAAATTAQPKRAAPKMAPAPQLVPKGPTSADS